jgi:hypothetical protein
MRKICTSGRIYYVLGGGRRKIHLVESAMSGVKGRKVGEMALFSRQMQRIAQ